MNAKKSKLTNQVNDGAVKGGLFKGVAIFVNGYTGSYAYTICSMDIPVRVDMQYTCLNNLGVILQLFITPRDSFKGDPG